MEFCSWCGDVVEGSVVRFGLTVLHPCCHEEMNDERDVCERRACVAKIPVDSLALPRDAGGSRTRIGSGRATPGCGPSCGFGGQKLCAASPCIRLLTVLT